MGSCLDFRAFIRLIPDLRDIPYLLLSSNNNHLMPNAL